MLLQLHLVRIIVIYKDTFCITSLKNKYIFFLIELPFTLKFFDFLSSNYF